MTQDRGLLLDLPDFFLYLIEREEFKEILLPQTYSLCHVEQSHNEVWIGHESLGFHGDEVVEVGHQVGEVVEAIPGEYGVQDFSHLQHAQADGFGRKRGRRLPQ